MKKELDEKLCKDYPKIFVNRHGDIKTTCMVWGFECGDGWYWLINQLCSQLQWDIDKNGYPQIVAAQVKEKYGSLRFYTDGSNESQAGMIQLAEFMSISICERCGSTDKVTQTKGWIVTLCDKCMAEYKTEHGDG